MELKDYFKQIREFNKVLQREEEPNYQPGAKPKSMKHYTGRPTHLSVLLEGRLPGNMADKPRHRYAKGGQVRKGFPGGGDVGSLGEYTSRSDFTMPRQREKPPKIRQSKLPLAPPPAWVPPPPPLPPVPPAPPLPQVVQQAVPTPPVVQPQVGPFVPPPPQYDPNAFPTLKLHPNETQEFHNRHRGQRDEPRYPKGDPRRDPQLVNMLDQAADIARQRARSPLSGQQFNNALGSQTFQNGMYFQDSAGRQRSHDKLNLEEGKKSDPNLTVDPTGELLVSKVDEANELKPKSRDYKGPVTVRRKVPATNPDEKNYFGLKRGQIGRDKQGRIYHFERSSAPSNRPVDNRVAYNELTGKYYNSDGEEIT